MPSMIKYFDYFPESENGSILIIVDNTAFKVDKTLFNRLSSRFLSDCCQLTKAPVDISAGSDALECYAIRAEVQISEVELEALITHILHDTALTDNPPFVHVLRLYIVSSPEKGDFPKIYRAAGKQLSAYMQTPLSIDFADYELFKKAIALSSGEESTQLRPLLRKALYYSYTTHDDITFDEASPPPDLPSSPNHTNPGASSTATGKTTTTTTSTTTTHITGSDAVLCERLMSQLSEHFSPTLFQPPAALHMECTDVYAALWMERAVQPAFVDNGTANPFHTLRRLRELDWKREVVVSGGQAEGSKEEPCEECIEHMRREWGEEARAIWERMDGWLEE